MGAEVEFEQQADRFTYNSLDWRYVIEVDPERTTRWRVKDQGRVVANGFLYVATAMRWVGQFDRGEVQATI